MRDIKFRAFDTENKEMLEVQELDYEDSPNGQPMVRTKMYNDYFDTEEMILMQYTGLKDKNGTEIYEGDIVKICSHGRYVIGKIIYEYCGFTADVTYNKELPYGRSTIIQPFVEVIGNIYDNPELLGE